MKNLYPPIARDASPPAVEIQSKTLASVVCCLGAMINLSIIPSDSRTEA